MYGYLNPYFGRLVPGYGSITPGGGGGGSCSGNDTYVNKFVSDPLVTTSQFGNAVALGDNICWVGAPAGSNKPGTVYVFTRASTSGAWTEDHTFQAATPVNNADFGWSMSYDEDNNRLAIGSIIGCDVDFYTLSGVTETHEQKIDANSGTGTSAGNDVAIFGNTCLVGVPGYSSSKGRVEYWENVTGTWTYRSSFQMGSQTPTNFQLFGNGVVLTDDATAYVQGRNMSPNELTIEKWTRSGTTWSYDSIFWADTGKTYFFNGNYSTRLRWINDTLIAVAGVASGGNGMMIAIDANGDYIETITYPEASGQWGWGLDNRGTDAIVGAPFRDPGATFNGGEVYTSILCY
ncbi:MAG: hypothetical protein GY906_22965 [bacterium]|nr:hypothetical protein [bacterium]